MTGSLWRLDSPSRRGSLRLDSPSFRRLLAWLGPSLGLWRAAEVAALREQVYQSPILDLGCGDGLVTSLVLPRVEIGLDPDPAVLARAARLGLYDRLEPAPAERMTLAEASVGTVISNSVLEHLPRLDAVIEEVARVLRPGGRLIFTVPTETFGAWLLLPFHRYAAWRNRQLGHLNLWPADRWAQDFGRVGLVLDAVRPYLRRELVRAWDALELLQQIRIGRRQLVGLLWRRLPSAALDHLARRASRLDLSAAGPSGGYLIAARKQ